MGQDFFNWLTATHAFAGFDWNYLVIIGLIGNAIFGSRFILQWITSERLGRSVVPKIFWHLSIYGSLTLAVYFVLRREPVGTLGLLPNSIIYLRNLQLVRKAERLQTEAAQ